MKTSQLINAIAVLLISVAVAVWSFFAYSNGSESLVEGWVFDGEVVQDADFSVSELSSARLNGRDSLYFLPGFSGQMSWNEDAEHVNVTLQSGGVAFAALAGDFSVSIATDFARVDSQNSRAYVELTDGVMQVYVKEHPSLLTFTMEGGDLNAISVPGGYRTKVQESKITATIGKLRLTKLSKEFPVFALDDEDMSSEVQEVFADMRESYTESTVEFLSRIQSASQFGPPAHGFAGTLNEYYASFREAVTFMPHAEERFKAELKEDFLAYAMTNLLYDKPGDAKLWLEDWVQFDHKADEVEDLYKALFFVLPGNELYEVKEAVSEVIFEEENAIDSLRRKYQEVESLLAKASQIEAKQAYEAYKTEFQLALNEGDFDDGKWLDDISREYVLLELMLRSQSVFYSTSDTELLSDLEDKILTLAGTDEDLDEERQAFVQSKIRFLTNLFDFVVDRKVSVDKATDLANELIFEAETHLNSVSAAAAVQKYFEETLNEFDLAVQFINSPEFYSTSDFDEGLAAYAMKVDDLDALNDYIQSLRSSNGADEVVTIELDEAMGEVEMALLYAGIKYSDIESLEDTAYRLFELKGAYIGEYNFEANYDRETEILYDVVVEDNLRFSTGLRLDNLRKVIDEAMTEKAAATDVGNSEDSEDGGDTAPVASSSSLTENVAIGEVEKAFEEAGLDTGDFDIVLVDLGANLFTFEGVITGYELPVSGTFDLISGQVSEIIWGDGLTMPDLDISQLEQAIEVTYGALRATM